MRRTNGPLRSAAAKRSGITAFVDGTAFAMAYGVRNRLIGAAVCILAAGCSSPTRPTTLDLSGTWERADGCTNAGGLHIEGCPIKMTIVQTGSEFSGSFAKEGTSGGSLSGTVANGAASATLTYTTVPECRLNVTGPVNGDRWRTSAVQVCTGLPLGPIPIEFVRMR
jgi:hypothetical protein